MIDIAHGFGAETLSGDLIFENGLLAQDPGLKTAILHSLFSDARVSLEEAQSVGGDDPRGWWGSVLHSDEPDNYGSKLWLLSREKQTDIVLKRAAAYAEEALTWLIQDGMVDNFEVEVEWKDISALALRIHLQMPGGQSLSHELAYPWGA